MRRVSKTLYGIPKLAGCSILWPEHVQHDQATARSQKGPSCIESEARLEEVVQSKTHHDGIEGLDREGKVLGERTDEMYRALDLALASEQQILSGQVHPDHRSCTRRERWEQEARAARDIQDALNVGAKGLTHPRCHFGRPQCGRLAEGLSLSRELRLDCFVVAQDAA
jgi:hypothetical protein